MKSSKRYLWLILAIFWIGLVFLLSAGTETDSHELSSSLSAKLGSMMIPDFASWAPSVQRDWIIGMDQLMRKIAHFVEFALLGMLLFSFLFASAKARKKKNINKMRTGIIAFFCCLPVAAVDEVIQLSSAGRTSSSSDVLLDCAGAVIGILIVAYRAKLPQYSARAGGGVRRNP